MLQIISVGKLSSVLEAVGAHYSKMITWKLEHFELQSIKGQNPQAIISAEAKSIGKYLKQNSYKIALDVVGKEFDSHSFASMLQQNMSSSNCIQFIIGGAFGLDKSILNSVNIKLSLSKMTFTHQIAKVLLLEQIYRAQSIISNHPYHK